MYSALDVKNTFKIVILVFVKDLLDMDPCKIDIPIVFRVFLEKLPIKNPKTPKPR